LKNSAKNFNKESDDMDNAKFKGYESIFASRLRDLMDSRKVTQSNLAERTGITRQTISQYMDGSTMPNVETLHSMCVYFDVPSDYLLGRTDSISNDITNQSIQDKTGLTSESIKTLEKTNHNRSPYQFNRTYKKYYIDFVNYVLSDKRFLLDLPEALHSYYETKIYEYNGEFVSKEIRTSRYILMSIIEELIDDCFVAFGNRVSVELTKKKKPGRKRKET
jgi:transcriptional regulator with XRE-family HTH domain